MGGGEEAHYSYGCPDDNCDERGDETGGREEAGSESEDSAEGSQELPPSAFAEVVRQMTQVVGARQLVEALENSSELSLLQVRLEAKRIRFGMEPKQFRPSPSANWHLRMAAADMLQDAAERSASVFEITRDFMHTAKMYGQLIISERALPLWEKSIKPVRLGGVAGGDKYLVGGILFKFSQDVELAPHVFMYGGNARDDDSAHKASGHELKAIEVLMRKADPTHLRVPLMTLVDFRGCRLSAQSLLPLGGLIYGSADAARTVITEQDAAATSTSAAIFQSIRKLSSDLNLAEHNVTETSTGKVKTICFPVDIEIHRSAMEPDVALIIDTARLMPPVAPQNNANKREIFYKLFRPEFVQSYREPLSSDAFSSFGAVDKEKHHRVISEATRCLLDELIPRVALSMTLADTKNISRHLQQNGVNVRFLGLVRSHAADETIREALLMEMVARVLHKKLKASWRAEQSFDVLPLLKIVVSVFNESITSKCETVVRSELIRKFGPSALFAADEMLMPRLALPRLAELAGVAVDPEVFHSGELISVSDVSLLAKVKELGFSAVAAADALYREAKGRASAQRAVDLLRQGAVIIRREIVSDPRNVELKCRLCRLLLAIGKRLYGGKAPEWEAASRDFLGELDRLPRSVSERAFFEAQFHRSCALRSMQMLEMADAFRSWNLAARTVLEVDTKQNWLLVNDAIHAFKKVDRFRTKLFESDFLALVQSIATPTDYVAAKEAASPFQLSSAYLHILGSLAAEDWQVSKVVGLAVELGVHGEWLGKQPQVSVCDLTHCPVDNVFLDKLTRFPAKSLRSLSLRRAVCSSIAALVPMMAVCSELELDNCPRLMQQELLDSLAGMPLLKRLGLREMAQIRGDALWPTLARLPQLEAVDVTGNPFLVGPSAVVPGLEKVVVLTVDCCICLSVDLVFLACFPLLTELRADDLTSDSAARLPSATLALLHLGRGTLTGSELPESMPTLRDVWLGCEMTSEGLLHLSCIAPNLERLNVSKCRKLENVAVGESLAKWSLLTHLDISGCVILSNQFVTEPLKRSGAKLLALRSTPVYAVTSAEVAKVIDLKGFRVLAFYSPRDPLLLALPDTLTSLTLGNCQVISEAAWVRIVAVSVNLKTISFSGLSNVTDSILTRMLDRAEKIQSITLKSLPEVTGKGLAVAASRRRLMGLKLLSLTSCCGAEEEMLTTLQHTPNLEMLELEASGDSNAALMILAKHCKKLRALTIASAQKAATFFDEQGWLVKIGSLRSVVVTHMYKLAMETLARCSRIGQLSRISTINLFSIGEDQVNELARCRNLMELCLLRSCLSMPQLMRLSASNLPLFYFVVYVTQARNMLEQIFPLLGSLKTLRYLQLCDDPTYEHFPIPSWYEGCFVASKEHFSEVEQRRTAEVEDRLSDLVLAGEKMGSEHFGPVRAVVDTVADPSLRPKWCYMTWLFNDFSLRLALGLATRGFQVIVGVPEPEDGPPFDYYLRVSEENAHMTRLVSKELTPARGFYFTPVSFRRLANRSFEKDVMAITPKLDLVFAFYANERLHPKIDLKMTLFTPPEGEGVGAYMHPSATAQLYSQLNVVTGLHQVMKASPNPIVVFHSNALGSISETNTSSSHAWRVAFAGVSSMVKSLSFEYPHGIVVGVHPGIWFSNIESLVGAGTLAPAEAASRFIQAVMRLQKGHSGKVVRHTMDTLPP